MSTALQLSNQSSSAVAEWQVVREQASVLVTTGFLSPSVKTPEQAMAIILTGRELGIGPMAALNNINIIQGKPSVSPQLMLAMINSTREAEDIAIETSDAGAVCTIKRRGRTAYTAKFGPKEAKAMGLDGKDNYKKQAATMYQWRAVAAAARATFPEVILGMYTPDELGAITTEDGEVVEQSPEPDSTDKALKTIFIEAGKTEAEWNALYTGEIISLSMEAKKKKLAAWQKAALDRKAKAEAQSPNVHLNQIEECFTKLTGLGVSKAEQDQLVSKVTLGAPLDECDNPMLRDVVTALTAAIDEASNG